MPKEFLRIKNWKSFQHYRYRQPKWIKLHSKLLSSADWVMASQDERVLMIACMLVASQSEYRDGKFDADPSFLQRVAYLPTPPSFKSLISRGFLEYASRCTHLVQNGEPELELELELETESESQVKTIAQQMPLSVISESRFDIFWKAYPRKVGKPAAQKAWKGIKGIESHSGEVLAGVSRWIAHWTDKQFIPYPATFLNQRRWEDEIPKKGDDNASRIAATFRH